MKSLCWLLLAFATAVGCSPAPDATDASADGDRVERPGQPDFVRSGFDQEQMERAMAKARQTQEDFITALQSQPPGTSDYFIKKAFDGEHIWLSDVEWNGRSFSAAVSNVPVETSQIRLGDRVEVSPEELSDWMYVEDGVLRGGYTIRVLHYASTAEEQQATLRNQSFTIPPIDF